MKIVALTILLMLSNFAHADWTLVSTSTKGDEFYIDALTLKKDGISRKIWVMTNFGIPVDYKQQKVLSQKEFVEFVCPEDKSRTLTYALYSEKNGQGSMIDRLTFEPPWNYSIPDTSFYTVTKKVCK